MALPRRSLLLALLACVAAGAFAARMPGDLHIMEAELSESLVSLSGASSAVHAADEANSGAPVTLEGECRAESGEFCGRFLPFRVWCAHSGVPDSLHGK
jgi:hypothetical protein